MTPRTRTVSLAVTLAVSLLLLALFLANLHLTDATKRPAEAQALARWIAEHPADAYAASALSNASLDSTLPRRRELWRSAYALTHYLAPRRASTAHGFVRAGLFHWYELGPQERKAVLDVAAPLLRDPQVFAQLFTPLWNLTRDFNYLRRVAPPTLTALDELRQVALTNGLFPEYRTLREEMRRARLQAFTARAADLQPADMLALLPQHLDTGDAPLVRAMLEELDRRAYEPQQLGGRGADLAEFAIEQRIEPLSALSPMVEDPHVAGDTRARLARALGDLAAATRIELTTAVAVRAPEADKWVGLCSLDEICTSARIHHAGPLSLTLSVSQSDEVAPYVEIFVDGRLAAEGEVTDARTFALDASAAMHRYDVRLVNPRTRNGIQRRVRLS